jgi:hypothetical protein
VNALILAERSVSSFRVEFLHVEEAILDVVGRGNIIHFQIGLGAREFFVHGFQDGVRGDCFFRGGGGIGCCGGLLRVGRRRE